MHGWELIFAAGAFRTSDRTGGKLVAIAICLLPGDNQNGYSDLLHVTRRG